MAWALAEVAGSSRSGADKPCRSALRLDFERPAAVLGPVLFHALAPLAAICFSLAIGALLSRLLGGVVRAAIPAPGRTFVFLAQQATPAFPRSYHAVEQQQASAFDLRGYESAEMPAAKIIQPRKFWVQ
jgi:hypothetical protein